MLSASEGLPGDTRLHNLLALPAETIRRLKVLAAERGSSISRMLTEQLDELLNAMIVQGAAQLGCSMLYSKDLNAGQRYDGVLVVNPFA